MKKGIVLIILAGMLWGTSCVFVKFLAPYGLDSTQMTALRMSIAALGLLCYCGCFRRKSLKVRLRDLPLFALCGCTMFATAAFYYESMQLTSASTAVVLMYLSPVPIMLLSVVFLGERFTAKKGVAMVLMLLGCGLVAGIVGNFKPNPLGVLLGLLSAASYTVYNIFNKIESRRGIDPICASLYTFLFAGICALLVCKPWQIPGILAQDPEYLVPMVILHSMATCLLPYLIYTVSLKYLSVGVASALSIVEPMFGSILGFTVCQDPLTPFTLIGIVLVIGSVFLLGISE